VGLHRGSGGTGGASLRATGTARKSAGSIAPAIPAPVEGFRSTPAAEDQISERALTVASRLRKLGSIVLKTLHVLPEAIKPFHRHRVDMSTGKLVSEPIQSRRR
jgi:hypothetical protein